MTLFQGLGFWASSLSGAKPGMVLVKPTSISHSGTSATLGANGQVTFSAVTSLSLNGCFTADFKNYATVMQTTNSAGVLVNARLRAAGSDASGNNYIHQVLTGDGSTVTVFRVSATNQVGIAAMDTGRNGATVFIYGPFLAQPTAFRSVGINSLSGAVNPNYAGTHSLSTAYDGITIIPASGNFSGTLTMYGLRS
jgi:hypothetical protein